MVVRAPRRVGSPDWVVGRLGWAAQPLLPLLPLRSLRPLRPRIHDEGRPLTVSSPVQSCPGGFCHLCLRYLRLKRETRQSASAGWAQWAVAIAVFLTT